MIVTVTPNPSLDRTIELPGVLTRGAVLRATASSAVPAGKGINVSLAVDTFGAETVAVLPGASDDPLVVALSARGLRMHAEPIAGALRSNVTITEPDGTTTKVNEPGPQLSSDEIAGLTAAIRAQLDGAEWLALCGSLPRGLDVDFYAQVVESLGGDAPRVALDSSGAPAQAAIGRVTIDLIKPNAEELLELLGETGDADELEADPAAAARLAARLLDRGVAAVLCTLGSRGAVLVTRNGSWVAAAPRIDARSTVGAGDSSLAGYLLAQAAGMSPSECLRRAIAHGSAAAEQPGSTMPGRADVDRLLPLISVRELDIAAGQASA